LLQFNGTGAIIVLARINGGVMRCSRILRHAVALVPLLSGLAQADDIVTSWNSVHLPPPPSLSSVTIDPAHTALLVLDFDAGNCTMAERPTCVASLPKVAALLGAARQHNMMVVYSTTLTGSIKSVPPLLAPKGDETVVSAGVDKFLGTKLEAALKAKHIQTIIVTGTVAHGAVLFTATAASLRGFKTAVPVDTLSAPDPFAELSTTWILSNEPASVAKNMTVTRSDMIQF
jgi:nicotinamidase-related amidase